jgi:uncharacterized membrane protein required for colicin V production
MYWLDTTILAVLGIGAIFGALTGLLLQLARIVGFAVALYAAIFFNKDVAAFLQRQFMQDAEPWVARLVAYAAVFLFVYLAIFVFSITLERGMKSVRLQALNRALGAALGAGKAALILGALFMGLADLPHPSTREMIQKSTLAPLLSRGVKTLVTALLSEYRDEVRGGLEELSEGVPLLVAPRSARRGG